MTTPPIPSSWPTREDGSNKTVGEMTAEERREVLRAAVERLRQRLSREAA